MGDWQLNTPHNNRINNFHGTHVLVLNDGTSIKNIQQWYFYHDHIVGIRNDAENESPLYFVVNEKSNLVEMFTDQKSWNEHIKEHHLVPKVWTRWHLDNWVYFGDTFLFVYLFYFFFSIPITLLLLWLLIKAIVKERFRLNQPYTLMMTGICLILLVRILLDQFPQSI